MQALGFLAQAYYKERELKTLRPLSLWRKKMRSKKEQGIILKKLGEFYQQLKDFEKASPKLARVQILDLSTVCSIALVKLIQN